VTATEFSVRKRHAFRPTVLCRNLHNTVMVVKTLYIIIIKLSASGGFASRLSPGQNFLDPSSKFFSPKKISGYATGPDLPLKGALTHLWYSHILGKAQTRNRLISKFYMCCFQSNSKMRCALPTFRKLNRIVVMSAI